MTRSINALKLQALSEISAVVHKALNLEQALDEVLRILARTLDMERGTITLQAPDSGQLTIMAAFGPSSGKQAWGAFRCARGVTERIFRTMRPLHAPDVRSDPLFPDTGEDHEDEGSIPYTGVPVILDNAPVGVLSVDRLFDDGFSVLEDIDFLTTLGALVARLVRLNETIRGREQKLRHENAALKYRVSKETDGPSLVGKSPTMQEVERLLSRAASASAPVLLLGESGTGRTHAARIIHGLSDHRAGPFVRVDCAARPEDVLERMLFGSGGDPAQTALPRPGRIKEAQGGSLLLENIDELPPRLQSRMRHLLQGRESGRPETSGAMGPHARILAASTRDLKDLMQRDLFDPALYYRLNVLTIAVPPLRRRKEDVAGLFNHFRRRTADACGRDLYCTSEALDLLLRHDWPGNVRELENIVERLVIMAGDGRIGKRLVRQALTAEAAARDKNRPAPAAGDAVRSEKTRAKPTLMEMERNEILLALSESGWIKRRAGRLLGLTERQIGYRIKKFDLEARVAAERRRLRDQRRR